jgi:DNA-directed RNA polymerase specialized sigma24 family protein
LETNYFSKFGGYNMSFNNGLERKKFEAAWKKLRVEYAAAGMDEAAVEAMYQFDLDTFNSERRYAEHTQELPFQQFDDDGDTAGEDTSALLVKFFDAFAVMPQETVGTNRYGWVEEIRSKTLSAAVQRLSEADIELLTLHVYEGYGVSEIAKMKGVTQSAISQKIIRIKKFLKNF